MLPKKQQELLENVSKAEDMTDEQAALVAEGLFG